MEFCTRANRTNTVKSHQKNHVKQVKHNYLKHVQITADRAQACRDTAPQAHTAHQTHIKTIRSNMIKSHQTKQTRSSHLIQTEQIQITAKPRKAQRVKQSDSTSNTVHSNHVKTEPITSNAYPAIKSVTTNRGNQHLSISE